MTQLTFRDLLILHLMVSQVEEDGTTPRQRDLFDEVNKIPGRDVKSGKINETLVEWGVPPIYASPVTGFKQISSSVARLRAAGMLKPQNPLFKREAYQVTEAGKIVAHDLGARPWKDWPLNIRATADGFADWENALYGR